MVHTKSGYKRLDETIGQQELGNQDKVKKYINNNPELFTVLSVLGGHCGNLLLRILAGTDARWLWTRTMSMSVEDASNSGPLDWPRNTEGYLIYDIYNWELAKGNRTWASYFKENHLASAHVSISNIEYITDDLFTQYVSAAIRTNKSLLIRSHNLDIHTELPNVKVIKVHGNLRDIIKPQAARNNSRYYMRNFITVAPSISSNVYNLDIGKLVNRDYNIFIDEYLKLCEHFDMYPNISNVRAYILLWIERMDRVTNDT